MSTNVVTRINSADKDLVVALQDAGVEVTWHPSAHTTTFLISYAANDLDHPTQSVMALAEPIQAMNFAEGFCQNSGRQCRGDDSRFVI